jgi:VanZ family protein
MPISLAHLLHAPASRPWWRRTLALLMAVICVLAFSPTAPKLDIAEGDKVQHILAFACLAACAALSQRRGWAAAAMAAAAMLAFGVFIEFVQWFIPSRSADWHDVVADALGIALGLLTVAVVRRLQPSSPAT